MKEAKDANEVIQMITDVLSGASVYFLAEIANKVLSQKVTVEVTAEDTKIILES